MNKIGIRSEEKHWDSRVTISPQDIPRLPNSITIRFQNDGERSLPFKKRVFSNKELLAAGQKTGALVEVGDDLHDCQVILGTKEIKEVYVALDPDEIPQAQEESARIQATVPQFTFDARLRQIRLTEFLTEGEKATLQKMAHKSKFEAHVAELISRQDSLIEPGKAYMFFTHTHKGQTYNMRMLRRFMDARCTLLDYELLRTDTNGGSKRTVTYGNWAGIIGILDTLWAYGQHFHLRKGVEHPFLKVRCRECYDSSIFEYTSLQNIKRTVQEIAAEIRVNGLPEVAKIGIAGYRGEAGRGVLELLEKCGLPLVELDPDEFATRTRAKDYQFRKDVIYLIKLDYQHLYRPKSGADLARSELRSVIKAGKGYLLESNLEAFFGDLTLFVNCIVWNKEAPRLLTNAFLHNLYHETKAEPDSLLPVIGDITCDPNGSVQCSRDTYPDNPVYMWIPEHSEEPLLPDFDLKKADAGFEYFDLNQRGFVVMAVTNLPCEIPGDASIAFSRAFCARRDELGGKSYVECLAEAHLDADFKNCGLPRSLTDAVILYHGKFHGANRQLMLKEICLAMLETETIKPEQVLPVI